MRGRLALAGLVAALMQPVVPPLRTIDGGPSSQIHIERLAVARDEGEWARLWMEHAPARPRPSIDFAKEAVVGVFAGVRPTAGYSVEIVGYREAAGAIVVLYRESAPAPGTLAAQVLTAPYAIATIPHPAGAVTFEKADR
jgi:hypothetical protein